MDHWTDLPRRIGRYEIVRPLGHGGGGRVVEAILHGPAGFRKSVALKVLHAGGAAIEGALPRLLREARFGALLSHPNLISTLELGQADGIWFVSMELVRGRDLSSLSRQGPLSAAALVDIGLHVSAALSHIHELADRGRSLGLIHGDVKPSNLLLDPSGLVRLGDFGLAGLQAELAGRKIGTLGFAAPEQVDGAARPQSDLFALGATLLTLCVGDNPLGRGLVGLRSAFVIEDRLADPTFLAPAEACLPGLAAVLSRCLRQDPADRFPDARHLAHALKTLEGRGPSLAEISANLDPTLLRGIEIGHTPSPTPPRDRLLGRDLEVRQLLAALRAGHPVVTIVGPAGVGKTRLALEVGHAIVDRSVTVCELVSAHDATDLCAVVARALGGDLRDGDPIDQVGAMIRGLDHGLLILDNVEQVIEDAAAVLMRWRGLGAQFLVTSRSPLHLNDEQVVDLGPLDLDAAITLFCARRGAAVPMGERDGLVEILEGVDRIPLAIELLAARGRQLSVSTLRDRLGDRFRLLVGASRDADPRHRTLHSAIRWSWDLLEPWGQAGLTQLSVFEGAFDLMAAEAVLERTEGSPWALDVLEALVDQSLIRVVQGDRFALLRSVRDFAAQQGDPDRLRRAQIHHGTWFAALGSPEARTALSRPGGGARLIALARIFPDLVASARRAVARRDIAVAGATAMAALEVTALRGPAELGITLAESVLALPVSPRLRAELRERAGDLRITLGNEDQALSDLQAARATFEDLGDLGAIARTRSRIGRMYRLRGRLPDAQSELDSALDQARAAGEREPEIRILNELGLLHQANNRPDLAIPLLEASLAVAIAAGHRRGQGVALANLGVARWFVDDLAGARRAYERSEACLDEVGDHHAAAIVLGYRGLLDLKLGHRAQAAEQLAAASARHRRNGARRQYALVLGNLGLVERLRGRPEPGMRHLQAAIEIHRSIDDLRSAAPMIGNLAWCHADLGDSRASRILFEEALALDLEFGNTRSAALVSCGIAELDLADQALERVEIGLDAATEHVGNEPWPDVLGSIDEIRSRLQLQQGDLAGATRSIDRAATHLQTVVEPYGHLRLYTTRGHIAAATGDLDRAQTYLAAAEEMEGDEGWPDPLLQDLDALRRRLRIEGPSSP